MSEFFDSFRFADPWWLLALLVIPPLAWLNRRSGVTGAITFPTLSVLVTLGERPNRLIGKFSSWIILLALISAIIAMARPQKVEQIVSRSASGIDIMLALDVSGSMEAPDFYRQGNRIDRITAAKAVSAAFINRRTDDRIGLVAFAGQPYLASPITLDHDFLLDTLQNEISTKLLPDSGTAIGSAIASSAVALNDREAKSKVIVLVTDGKSNSGKMPPLDAADNALKLGIKIYTIAIGTKEGRANLGYGYTPKQEFDAPTLKKIAAKTGGEFYHAETTEMLVDVFQSIDLLERTTIDSNQVLIPTEYYHWFAGAAAVFVLAALLSQAINPPPTP